MPVSTVVGVEGDSFPFTKTSFLALIRRVIGRSLSATLPPSSTILFFVITWLMPGSETCGIFNLEAVLDVVPILLTCCSNNIFEFAQAHRAPPAALFVDFRSAFYTVIRQGLFTSTLDDTSFMIATHRLGSGFIQINFVLC